MSYGNHSRLLIHLYIQTNIYSFQVTFVKTYNVVHNIYVSNIMYGDANKINKL